MGVFTKKDDFEQNMQKAENEAISSIIDSSMQLQGDLTFKGKARIDGHITGNVNGEHLILSKAGKIEGDVNVTSFICHGKLDGNAKGKLITLRKECAIRGKIEATSLTMEPGAVIDGIIKAATEDLKNNFPPPTASTAPTPATEK
jgi:cytoskeletal protein CcmA (bactofilin family)